VGIIAWKSDEGNYPFDTTHTVEPWMVTCFFHFNVSKYVVKRPTWNKGVCFKGRLASCPMSISMNHFKK
jgi:hypothetical protein